MASERVVGWMQGRMEFGPRALGCRSIIGDARSRAGLVLDACRSTGNQHDDGTVQLNVPAG